MNVSRLVLREKEVSVMNKFISLLNFEMNRFLKFLIPTFIAVAVIQLFETFRRIIGYNNELERVIASGEPLEQLSPFSVHDITGGGLFELSIVAIVLIFMVYSFFTWYREWLGKNTFIYRLLMLPMNRMSILITKSLVFLIGGLLAFVFQFGMYGLALIISEQMIPAEHYVAVGIHNAQPMYTLIQGVLFPTSIFQFISLYSFAFGALISLFTAIIIERTYRMKGLIVGVIYFIGYFILFGLITSLPYNQWLPFIIKPSQAVILTVVYQFFMIALGHLISWPLLKNKIKI